MAKIKIKKLNCVTNYRIYKKMPGRGFVLISVAYKNVTSKYRYNIEGKTYNSSYQAADYLNIKRNIVQNRCKSSVWPEWVRKKWRD